ncbi:hypothetical protein AB5L52_24130 [Streptomyces sp. CG4]
MGLLNLANDLSASLGGREVKFMIYESTEAAIAQKPCLVAKKP